MHAYKPEDHDLNAFVSYIFLCFIINIEINNKVKSINVGED
jgi:hypothetical protein